MRHSTKTEWDLATINSNQYGCALTGNLLCRKLKCVLGTNKINDRIEGAIELSRICCFICANG